MQNQRNWDTFVKLFQQVEVQLDFAPFKEMNISDGHRQRVDTRISNKSCRYLRVSQMTRMLLSGGLIGHPQ